MQKTKPKQNKTKHHKFSYLKLHKFIISQFSSIRSVHMI